MSIVFTGKPNDLHAKIIAEADKIRLKVERLIPVTVTKGKIFTLITHKYNGRAKVVHGNISNLPKLIRKYFQKQYTTKTLVITTSESLQNQLDAEDNPNLPTGSPIAVAELTLAMDDSFYELLLTGKNGKNKICDGLFNVTGASEVTVNITSPETALKSAQDARKLIKANDGDGKLPFTYLVPDKYEDYFTALVPDALNLTVEDRLRDTFKILVDYSIDYPTPVMYQALSGNAVFHRAHGIKIVPGLDVKTGELVHIAAGRSAGLIVVNPKQFVKVKTS